MNLGLASKFTQYSNSHLAYNYSFHQSDLLRNFYGKISTGRYRNRNLSKIEFILCHNEFEHAQNPEILRDINAKRTFVLADF